jgi:Sec-independent protein translocase protein TatA
MAPVDILLILIVILIVVLIWRGPSMLPQFGEALGKAVKGARDSMDRDSDTSATSTEAEADDDTAQRDQ